MNVQPTPPKPMSDTVPPEEEEDPLAPTPNELENLYFHDCGPQDLEWLLLEWLLLEWGEAAKV